MEGMDNIDSIIVKCVAFFIFGIILPFSAAALAMFIFGATAEISSLVGLIFLIIGITFYSTTFDPRNNGKDDINE